MGKRSKRRDESREAKARIVCYVCDTIFNPDQYAAHDSSAEHQANIASKSLDVVIQRLFPTIPAHQCASYILRRGDPRRAMYTQSVL